MGCVGPFGLKIAGDNTTIPCNVTVAECNSDQSVSPMFDSMALSAPRDLRAEYVKRTARLEIELEGSPGVMEEAPLPVIRLIDILAIKACFAEIYRLQFQHHYFCLK